MTERQKQRIIALAATLTANQIAAKLKLKQRVVKQFLRDEGVEAVPPTPLGDRDRVLAVMKKVDWDYELAARELGVSKQALYMRLPGGRKKHGSGKR